MPVNYTPFSEAFSQTRTGMKWEEIQYFIGKIHTENKNTPSILDIGCGNGRLIESLEEHIKDYQYLGTDSSHGMIEEAKRLHPTKQFLVCNMTQLENMSHHSYDYIFFIASFHHLEKYQERIETLKICKHILKPNGKIFLTNWNLIKQEKYQKCITKTYPHGAADFSIKFGEYQRFYHGFTLDSLREIFEEVGFLTEEHRIFTNNRNILSILSHETQ